MARARPAISGVLSACPAGALSTERDEDRGPAGPGHRASRVSASPATSRRPHWPGCPSCMTGTLRMLALPSAADEAAWAVLGPCGNRR